MSKQVESVIAGVAGAQSLLRARLLPTYPVSIVLGGFEHQCLQTCRALTSLGVQAKILNWECYDGEFDVLHLFGASPNWYDLCMQARNKYTIVVSAIASSRGKHSLLNLASRLSTSLARMAHQNTDYGRVRQTLAMVDRIMCLNDLERRFFLSFYDLPVEKVVVIPNGVSESRFSADGTLFKTHYSISDYVLFVGNIVSRKNPHMLAEVLKRRGWPGVYIGGVLPSEQRYANEFEMLVQSAPNLLWIRGLAYDDPLLASAFAGARVLCLPSIAETQPLSAMEAMAVGTPVILADRPYAHQPPFENAVRCDISSSESLEQALESVLANPDAHRVFLPERYRWKQVAEEVLETYRQAIASK